jgi:hypothetical protein
MINNSEQASIPSFVQRRRHFLKVLGAGAGTLLLNTAITSCSEEHQSELYSNFLDPKAEAKPFFRWWWNGNRLSKEELSREMELMHEAGIGGIEINPIQMPAQAENISGQEYQWLSDDWIEFLKFAIEKAGKLGMVTDLIVGTGWPFGGEFLDPDETIQGLIVDAIPIKGPGKSEIELPTAEQAKIKTIVLFPAKVGGLAEAIDIPFQESDTSIIVDVPSGNYELHILSLKNNFRQVMHGAPGGAGPVLDHFNKTAVEKYLNHMSDKIKEKLGEEKLKGIRAMFCDSIELSGANWTYGFDTLFEKRRGYDITPYLPLLLRKELNIKDSFEDELKRARYDYSLTLAELFMESFIMPFHKWCNENGTLSRYQAYGHPWLYTDLIEGYLIPDIPEGDQWLFNGSWQPYADVDQIRYAIWNKYASSAGHLAARKIVSSEAMTNTSGVFKASLKYIKQATDLNIATGINHQVLHGYNYSPPEAGFPGWIRYGCYFNEKNPWWPYMPKWSSYSARLSQVLQDSSAISQVAIMGPTLDIWSDHGLDRNPFNLHPWYLHAFWQALNHLGFCSDFVNANLLKQARLEGGNILIGSMKYEVLLLCDIETMEIDVVRKIEQLTIQGARIIIIGKKPTRSPNMIGALKNDGIVKKSMENAFNAGILVAPSPEEELQKSQASLMNWADLLMKNSGVFPYIEFSNPSPKLFQIQHKKEDTNILFITNIDQKASYESEISLGQHTGIAATWNPETGEKNWIPTNENGRIQVFLEPLESKLIITDPKEEQLSKGALNRCRESSSVTEIAGPWEVITVDAEGRKGSLTIDELKLINDIKGYEDFGGEIYYKTRFISDKTDLSWLIIDEVNETAEVKLNGSNIGVSWYGNNCFGIKEKLKTGNNTLEIKVTTLLANYAASLKENKTAQIWVSRYKDKTPVKCGLAGKVSLK